MQVIGEILGAANAGGQGAQPGRQMTPMVPGGGAGTAPVDPGAPGTPTFASRAAAAVGAANAGAGAVKQLEHPAWGVIDKLAGGDRMGFAQNNPEIMNVVKSLFD